MTGSKDERDRRVADIIQQRAGAGGNALVAGWQRMLADMLAKTAPYLSPGRLVTFQTLRAEESAFFEALHGAVVVPPHVTALYIAPSVRHQMMGAAPTPERPPDDGILLASRHKDYGIIVNALFARPPHTPAIDVYEDGQLVAGYSYARLDACQEEISAVLGRHLKAPTPGS